MTLRVTVHFDCVDAETSHTDIGSSLKGKLDHSAQMYVNAMQGADDEFNVRTKCEYKDLFTGIGKMNTTINI